MHAGPVPVEPFDRHSRSGEEELGELERHRHEHRDHGRGRHGSRQVSCVKMAAG
jgi:hypothetical protein